MYRKHVKDQFDMQNDCIVAILQKLGTPQSPQVQDRKLAVAVVKNFHIKIIAIDLDSAPKITYSL